jgi:transketolase
MAAAERLSDRRVRVVSMPCCEAFEAQDAAYREAVLPSDCLARVAIEAGHPDFWYKYVGLDGRIVGIDRFGESAPAAALFEAFGFTVDNVLAHAGEVLETA